MFIVQYYGGWLNYQCVYATYLYVVYTSFPLILDARNKCVNNFFFISQTIAFCVEYRCETKMATWETEIEKEPPKGNKVLKKAMHMSVLRLCHSMIILFDKYDTNIMRI